MSALHQNVRQHRKVLLIEPIPTTYTLSIECLLRKARFPCSYSLMKTLTVEEAAHGLGQLVDFALAGEQIQIRKGNGIVELRPANPARDGVGEQISPRDALRRLQEDGTLKPGEAELYLNELREERMAATDRQPA
jgi:hypothetical protein